ncbi:non-ribosomal peptide synthetase [Halalkalibacter alkalisediminis]|uniref:Non-ribosomal peptide synthetase n=1 Tax=Halalkalibacter alkalisediminis TaxID=935616 RepID=A0ABV6NP85_9BACI|nr:non-ribosomal peptide synthetase [Halalkalibacter alkalisediminis]
MRKSIENIYSLTPLQEGILYELEMKDYTEHLYISQMKIKIAGPLNVDALFAAWNHVIERHEALRMRLITKNVENNVQVVFDTLDYQPELIDVSALTAEEKLKELDRISHKGKEMDVNNSNLMKLHLVKLEEKLFTLIWTHHHIILDGWSTSIVINELFERYGQIVQAEVRDLVEKPRQYGDFIRYMNKVNKEDLTIFWKEKAKGLDRPTITFSALPDVKADQKDSHIFWELSHELSRELREFAAINHVTVNVLLQLIWSIVLKEMSQKEKIVFGIVSSGRSSQLYRSEEIVGLLINTLPVITEIKEPANIKEVLKEFQNTLNHMLEYSQISLVDIKQYTNVKKEDPLFETLFVYENYPEAAKNSDIDLDWEIQGGSEAHSFPLSLQAQDNKEAIFCKLYFHLQFIEPALAEVIHEAFMEIANQITKVSTIKDITLTTPFPINGKKEGELNQSNAMLTSFVHEPLKEIWLEFFPNEESDPDADFFLIGGHSIKAMKFISRVNKKLNVNLTLKELFENPTLASLSKKLFPPMPTSSSTLEEKIRVSVKQVLEEVLAIEHIDPNADFFELGGHSITAMKVVSKLNKVSKNAITLKAIFEHPSVNSLSTYLSTKMDDQIRNESCSETAQYVLSSNQEALWFNEKLGNSTSYTIPQKYRVKGKLDAVLLEKALNLVIKRHESLRTVVREKGGKGFQEIREDVSIKLSEENIENLSEELQLTRLSKIEETLQSMSFDVEEGPLLVVRLVKLSESEFVLYVNIHHLIFDGWSVGIFWDEWLSFYDSLMNETKPNLDLDFKQYKDVAAEQRSWLEVHAKKEMEFWKNNLSGDLPKLELPLDSSRLKDSTNPGSSFIVEVKKEELERLKSMSFDRNSTLYMTLLTMYQTFLIRYTGQDEVIVGSPLANRLIEGTERTIGYFVNTLPFRLKVNSDDTFRSILARNVEHIIDVYDHQQMPLDKIVEALNPERSSTSTSLFQTAFILQNNAVNFQSEYVTITSEILKSQKAKFDLSLAVEELDGRLLLAFEYQSEIFQEETIQQLSENFLAWIRRIIDMPELSIYQVPGISESQEKLLLEEWQGEQVTFEGMDDTIPEAFFKIVRQFPNKIAIVDGAKSITYEKLNQKSNQLARYLLGKGISKEEKVGIYVNRSIDMVIGMLAVIKAGASYVPLDPHYPVDRLSYIIEDSSLSYCLTNKELGKSELVASSEFIFLETVEAEAETLGATNIDMSESTNLAYVIYTSGTTGRPKGVMLEHKGIINLVYSQKKMLCLDPSAKLLQFATFNFDSSVIEIFSTLLFGAELNISFDKENQFDMDKLVDQIKAAEITHIILPPAILKELPIDQLNSIKVLGSAGSECTVELVSKFKQITFFNAYGPTEYSVCTSYKLFLPNEDIQDAHVVPIGKPITNTNVLVLDRHRNLMPIGSVGELYVGGLGIARGYMNLEELTNERFIVNPYNPNEKLYKTGDLVKFNKVGELVYIGRADDQVKIRGYRIELSEVNMALLQIDEITNSVVTVMEDSNGSKKLIAYYTIASEVTEEAIRKKVRAILPSFMIPSYFIKLEKFPLSPSGKIDKKALPKWTDYTNGRETTLPTVTELSKTETALLSIWREVLDDSFIGPDDNFFECGGDSIVSIQICSAAKEQGLFMTPKDLFESQTVRELASVVGETTQSVVSQDLVSGPVPLTPIQSWFLNENHQNIHHWNQSIVISKNHQLTTEQYREIIRALVEHHDGLRTVFEKQGDSYVGIIREANTACEVIDYSFFDIRDDECLKEIKKLEDEAQRSLNIIHGPLMKVLLFRDERHIRMFWVSHHLLIDGVSWRILLEDFEKCYQQITNKQTLSLPLKTTSFQQWSKTLMDYQANELTSDIVEYWQNEMNQTVSPVTQDLGEYCNGEHIYTFEANVEQTQNLLKNTLRKYKTTIDELLLSVIASGLSSQMGIDQFWVDLEGHGREQISDNLDLTRTVGWFTTMYPVRLEAGQSFGITLRNTKKRLRDVPNKGFDFGILKFLSEQDLNSPGSLVSYNYLGQFNNVDDMEQTQSNNIDENYVFPYKINVVASIINDRLTLNVMGDGRNSNFQAVCREIESLVTKLLTGNLGLSNAIVETDFESDQIVDESTINYFIKKFSNIEEIYPVTSLQEGMLFHSEIIQSSEYISQISFDITGNINLNLLEEAWNETARKFDVLRSVFRRNQTGDRYQLILSDSYYVFRHVDISMFSGEELQEKLDKLLVRNRNKPFDIENGPLMNITIAHLPNHRFTFIWTHHHALLDGWSLQVVMNHFLECYRNPMIVAKDTGEHRLAYKQVMRHIQTVDKKAEALFWKNELKNVGEVTPSLATKKKTDAGSNDRVMEYHLPEDLTEKVIEYARRHRKTINTVVQGVWGIVLSHFSESGSICYGVTSSGRNLSIPHIESAVGLLINTLPFTFNIDRNEDFKSYLTTVQMKQLQMREFESSSLTDIKRYGDVSWVQDLFQHIFVFENYPSTEQVTDSDIMIENFIGNESTNFDLTFSAAIVQTQLHYKLIYKENKYEESEIVRFMDEVQTIFTKLIEDESMTVGQLLNDMRVEVR